MADKTELNKAYFDDHAADYDDKFEPFINQMVLEIRNRRAFIGVDWAEECKSDKPVRMIDYACGTGTVSRALGPYVTQTIGVDLSPNMVAKFNARAKREGYGPERMSAIEGNILDPASLRDADLMEPLGLTGFDLATVGLAAHHFDDPALALKRLVERLRPGGVLFIVDMVEHEVPAHWQEVMAKYGHGHGHGHDHGGGHHHQAPGQQQEVLDHPALEGAMETITRMGFSEAKVREMFEQAGAGKDFNFELMPNLPMPFKEELKRDTFVARGTKA